ncbi:MAG UNVERIFIED_CONTAM: hypothetical protein LVT10_05665 [Anaerolineae bacterium]|jgi:hypothetical protein
MILGIDHVVLTVYDLDKALEEWQLLGFKTRFVEREIETHISKKSILEAFEPQHGIALVQGDYGLAIELVEHGQSLTTGTSPYAILIDTLTIPQTTDQAKMTIDDWQDAQTLISGYGTVWYHGNRNKSGFRSMILHTSDLLQTVEFWTKALHFTVQNIVNNCVTLAFQSVIPTWSLHLTLIESPTSHHSLLDSPGVTCISFITDRIEQDIKHLQTNNAQQVSEVFSLVVNNHKLRVVFFRSPTNELIEVITFK